MRLVYLTIGLTLVALLLSGSASSLDPQTFDTISSGVVKVRATRCRGGGVSYGSGFLVGTSVVLTAHHVVAGCRRASVLVRNAKWIPVTGEITWSDANRSLDVSTLKLATPTHDAWLFSLRPSQAPIGSFVAVLGYPLGEGVSYTNGRLVARIGRLVLLRILAAQGLSGGPIVDTDGRVVGLVNLGAGKPGVLTGANTGDNVAGYDLSSRWGGWRRTLCQTYPNGGIDDCP